MNGAAHFPSASHYRLFVQKDEHKFSCAHMTIFPDGSKEKLHGHNFHLSAAVLLPEQDESNMLDFALVKGALSKLCAELREHLLIPTRNSSVRIVRQDAAETELVVCQRRYVLPTDEVLLLPLPNLVVESLARYAWTRLVAMLQADLQRAGAQLLETTVTEAPGQGATYSAPLGPASNKEALP